MPVVRAERYRDSLHNINLSSLSFPASDRGWLLVAIAGIEAEASSKSAERAEVGREKIEQTILRLFSERQFAVAVSL